MIADRYSALLEELSNLLHIKLPLDENNACVIRLQDKLGVFMEPDRLREHLYITLDIGSPTPGQFREHVFREALKANGIPPPKTGIFAYGAKTDSLLLFERLSLDELNGPKLLETMQSLIRKARVWKEAIDHGEVPSYRMTEPAFAKQEGGTLPHAKNIFGLS